MALALRPLLGRFFDAIETRRGGRSAGVLLVLLLGVSFAWFTDVAGVHAIFGAFVAGAIVPRDTPLIKHAIRLATGGVLLALPLFFATVGFRIDVNLSRGIVDLRVCLLIIAVAIVSKLAATALAARAARFTIASPGWACRVTAERGAADLRFVAIVALVVGCEVVLPG